MEAKSFDPVEFRQGQRQQWNSAATGWRKWSELIDAAASGISERLVELAGVEPGNRVLDVAAGYGEPTLTAARGAGPEGSVVATDISAEMLAYGRERAALPGWRTSSSWSPMPASLEFPEDSFDAAPLTLRDHLRAGRRGGRRPCPRLSQARRANGDQLLGVAGAGAVPGDSDAHGDTAPATCRHPRPGRPGRSRAPRLRRWAACWAAAASPTSRWRRPRSRSSGSLPRSSPPSSRRSPRRSPR